MSLVLPSLPHNLPSGTSVASSLTVSRASHAREQWTGRLDYLLSCLGFAVGLGNVWRFPYMAFSNGGGAFFIPYFTMLIFTAMPVFVLESMVGQFSSLGATTCWEFCPFFRGCGVSMMFISGMTCIYYNMILAWAVYYIYASVAVEVPWFHCGNWSTAYCIENIKTVSIAECRYHNGTPASNGVCEQNVFDQVVLWDSRLAKISGVPIAFPAAEYFEREVLGCGRGYSMANMGSIKPHLLVSLILAWVLVFLCLYRGITISGKIVYVTALLPYGFLMVLFFRGVTLDGALEGIKYYIIPELDKTLSTTIWKNAGSQIFFSLSCAFGGLVTLSSYNKFHHDLLRDSLVVCLGNSLTSIFAGFVIFSFIGFLSKSTNIPISEVAAAGPTLAFIIYPFCLTKLPWTSLFSVFFFIMIILLGIDSQFVLVETVITGVLDWFPDLRLYKKRFVFLTCFTMCVLGLPLTFDGGVDVLDLMDTYVTGWNVMLVAICECLAIAIYGPERFLTDIDLMLGGKFCRCCRFNRAIKSWFKFCWLFSAPTLTLFVLVSSAVDYHRIEKLPKWADWIGWVISLSSAVFITVAALYTIYRMEGRGLQKLKNCFKPTKWWGPAQIEHRLLVAQYVEDFVVHPDVPESILAFDSVVDESEHIRRITSVDFSDYDSTYIS